MLSPVFYHSVAAGIALVMGLSLFISALWLVRDMLRLKSASKIGNDLLATVITLGNLTHELQKERGLSSAFTAQRLSDETPLKQQRLLSDQKLIEWSDLRDRQTLTGRAAIMRDKAQKALTALRPMREEVTARAAESPYVVAQYSEIISSLLDLSTSIVYSTARGPTSKLALAYANLLQSKEASGRERAVMSAALRTTPILPSSRSQIEDLIAQQSVYFTQFEGLIDHEMNQFVMYTLDMPNLAVMDMREKIFNSGVYPTYEEWFATSSKRIDALKAIEDRLAKMMMSSASQFVATSQSQTRLAYAMAGVGLSALLITVGSSLTLN